MTVSTIFKYVFNFKSSLFLLAPGGQISMLSPRELAPLLFVPVIIYSAYLTVSSRRQGCFCSSVPSVKNMVWPILEAWEIFIDSCRTSIPSFATNWLCDPGLDLDYPSCFHMWTWGDDSYLTRNGVPACRRRPRDSGFSMSPLCQV